MAGNIVEKVNDLVPIRHALISVSDKDELDLLVKGLHEACPDIKVFSTGGTFGVILKILGRKALKHLFQVSDYTGQPETQGGLVKTLDFKIYLGLLTETYNSAHQEDLKRTEAVPIDLVVVNLYPFQKTIKKPNVTLEEARANIDIGGPSMLRAAAKNFHRVAVVVNPNDYKGLIKELKENNGCTLLSDRFRLAIRAFEHTAEYDKHIAAYMKKVDFSNACDCYKIQN